MNISEIFFSIDGEGKRAGLPVIFIRTYGCNIQCRYCDSAYACTEGEFRQMSIDDILGEVQQYNCNRITFTGGEPLLQKDARELLEALNKDGYDVNVETNGTVDVTPFYDLENVWFTIDYKCPSSGMEPHMLYPELFNSMRSQDVLKFVVGCHEDLVKATEVIRSIDSKPAVYFSPVFGWIKPSEIVTYMLATGLNDVKFQLQIHKFVWDKDKRGV